MKENPRLIAFDILYKIFYNNAYSNIILDREIEKVSEENKKFTANIVYGVVKRKITLMYFINKHLTSRTKPKVKILLLMGAYQLKFMDKVPNHAAVNETVALAADVGAAYYSKLINAVLRKVESDDTDIDTIDDLSVRYSCPQNLINMWSKAYSAETTLSFLPYINDKPPVFAVANPLFVDNDECIYELKCDGIESEENNSMIEITSSFNLNKSNAFKRGLFHIQDMSSYLCAKALAPNNGDIVFDVCAAPGGKTFTLAEMMRGTGCVYSFDLHEHRVRLIEDGARRLCLNNVNALVNDAGVFNDNLPQADKILCDVPCSGFGIIRRKSEIRYKELDSVKELPEIQYKILSVSCLYLKAGGRIIYSTCTLNKRENEKVVERFLLSHNAFSLVEEKTFFPTPHGTDGFYYALMEKEND